MKSFWGISLSIVSSFFLWTVRLEVKSDQNLEKKQLKILGNENGSAHESSNPIEQVIKSFDIPRIVITDIWQTLAHYIGRNDLNSFERLEDIGQEILSGYNEREKGTVIFYLYNRQRNGSDIIKYGVVDHLRKSTFRTGKPVKFLIHGFKMNGFSHFNYLLKEAYLKHGSEHNIISVDWRRLAADHIYFNSAYNTRIVGERVGELIVFMKQNGFVSSYDDFHLIGFSLGSHVAGYAGKYVIKTERQQIGRITGLDPAGPTFTIPNPNNRLDSLDAKFVDVIHTSYGKSGIAQSVGHVDFYPNGGIEQPGCEWEKIRDYFLRNCSHERAFYLYLESIKGKMFIGCPCKNWEEFLQGNCNCHMNSPGAQILGEYCNSTARGDLFFETGNVFPSVPASPFKFSF